MTILGADLSHFQAVTSWPQVAGTCQFTALKATESVASATKRAVARNHPAPKITRPSITLNGVRHRLKPRFVDPTLQTRRSAAHAAGLVVGLYHFARDGDPAAEAAYFLKTVGPLQPGEFLVLDWEVPAANPPAWCKQWLDAVYAATGVRPLIYMNSSAMNGSDWSNIATDYGLWLAKYDNSQAQPAVKWWTAAAMKQYSDAGSVPGVVGTCDVDVFYGTRDQLLAYGYGGQDMPLTKADIDLWLNSTAYTGGPTISQALKNLDQFAAPVVRPDAPGGLVPLRQEIADAKTNTIKLVADVADVQAKLAALDPKAFSDAVVQAVQAMPSADAAQVADLVVAKLAQHLNTPPAS